MPANDYFSTLTENRKKIADVLDQPAARGLKNLLTGMYAESAHFIYELLQNADDVNATNTKFLLDRKGLTFIHNGTVPFSLSNPVMEDTDKEKGKLGHINSITSIGNSTKTFNSDFNESSFIRENKIGKFGIGFKSVFQYTNTPEIYDDHFKFKIERLIVPQILTVDHKLRKRNETLFYFPFNLSSKKISPSKAYEDILDKLKNLNNPILFLNSVKEINWELGNVKGTYTKKTLETKKINDIVKTKIRIKNYQEKKNFIVFTRSIFDSENPSVKHPFSIAFVTNNSFQKILYNETFVAYCFFPTRHESKLNFIVNGPFILTDNRENIKPQEDWNKKLVNELSNLCSDSLHILKNDKLVNDDFFNVLPINPKYFYHLDTLGNLLNPNNFFEPFYHKILTQLKESDLLPIENGRYFTNYDNAYLVRGEWLIKLLSQECEKTNIQVLNALLKNRSSQIVFSTVTEKQKVLWDYIKSNLVQDNIDPEKFARLITKDFIEQVSDLWLIDFYASLLDLPYLWRKGGRDSILRQKPIIILESSVKKVVPPFDNNDKPLVYLPSNIPTSFPTVKSVFIRNTKAKQFLTDMGLSKPELSAEIFHTIIPKYKSGKSVSNEELINDFEKLFKYYNSCPGNDRQDYINQLCNLRFLKNKAFGKNDELLSNPSVIYFPSEAIKLYFERSNAHLLDIDFYQSLYNKSNSENLQDFLMTIGVSKIPRKIPLQLNLNTSNLKKYGLDNIRYSKYYKFEDFTIDGFNNFLANITFQKSIIFWSFLVESTKSLPAYEVDSFFKGIFSFRYHRLQEREFDSEFLTSLRNSEWLYDKNQILIKPKDIALEELSEQYDLTKAAFLISTLGINQKSQNEIISKMSRRQREAYELGNQFISLGYSLEDLELLKNLKRKDITNKDIDITKETDPKTNIITPPENNFTPDDLTTKLIKGSRKKAENYKPKMTSLKNNEETEEDHDDIMLKPIDTAEEIKTKQEELEEEIAEIIKQDELIKIANSAEPYSFKWFKALLELEFNSRTVERIQQNPIYARFGKIEKDPDHDNTIILSETDFIPYGIEDNGSLKLTLYFKNQVNKVILLEAVSPQKKLLKAKIIDNTSIKDISFNEVESAVIEVKHADFIFENLKDAFNKFSNEPFSLPEDYNFKNNLTSNIHFVFGPPGTGKTTYLARNEIVPRILKDNLKILILAPTNKAADVLTNKIIEACVKVHDTTFPEWLVRFGLTSDPEIETSTIYSSTKRINKSLNNLVLITTIARFPYDIIKFDSKKGNEITFAIKDFDWDYIIFDESSMINLPSIIYTIYYTDLKRKLNNQKECNYIVAGDPFQINPIIQIAQVYWKNGNIYSLVGLSNEESFINPITEPHTYPITNLLTQFRSIPSIGSVYSNFSYSGKLKHHRSSNESFNVSIKNLALSPITVIEFPISKFDSIYKPRKIKGSPYHLYSAIFTVEFIKYILSNLITKKPFRIGVICPYRIQQLIIDKMLLSLTNNTGVNVITGTIHGFQGDECEMIINLLNPPNFINNNKNIFLNNKNLINVSISRARDYLILLFPVDPSNNYNIDNLTQLKLLKGIIKSNLEGTNSYKHYSSDEIERIILTKKGAIEEFSFPTNHQSINIYTNPAKKYEIRYDENAIDIQIKTFIP